MPVNTSTRGPADRGYCRIVTRDFIIITPGELYLVLCKVIPEECESVKPGLYLVTLAPVFRIMGNNWFIEGLTQMNSSANMNLDSEP